MTGLLSHLSWREPYWLCLALYPWAQWAVRAVLGRRGGKGYADPQLLPWARARSPARLGPRRLWRHGAIAIAWLLFALAAAGPRVAQTDYGQDRKHETQLMVVFDLSRSMTARDVAPGRLERARLELEDLVAREQGLRIGLVVYAARPHLMTPPTDDKSIVRQALGNLRYGLLPTEGSNLQAAMEFAAHQFLAGKSARALLLLTDGEASPDGAVGDARLYDTATRLAQQGITLYALGLGTRDGAPLQGREGGWLHYRDQAVVTRLHEHRLRRLAQLGNGRYAAASDTDTDWRTLYDDGIRYLHGGGTGRHGDKLIEWRELYAWCLVPAVVLLLLAYGQVRRESVGPALIPWLAVLVVFAAGHPSDVQAASRSWQQRAWRAYQDGSYAEAKRDYARVSGFAGRMGEGSSAYRLGAYGEAARHFTQAILDADTDEQRAWAIFNLANSRYRAGHYGQAVALYRETLRYKPGDEAARVNLEFARAMHRQQQRHIGRGGGSWPHGRGPRSTRAAQGMDLENAYIGFGDANKPRSPAGPPAPSTPRAGSDLIERGIHESRSAVRKATTYKDSQWKYAPTTPAQIARGADSLKVNESVLWKRIFEAEEGFPAPEETPQPLPGVPPW